MDSEDFIDDYDYHLNQYVGSKNTISEEDMKAMKDEESKPGYQKLISLGLADQSAELRDMKREIEQLKRSIDESLAHIREMRAGLEEIEEIPKEFEKNAVQNFKSWLESYLED
jgi:predicted negative regulator of RcsB-dependent stress response